MTLYTPTLEEVQSRAGNARTVAISREVDADLDTPVSAYLKLRGSGPSFLLESAEGVERVGRYSFVGGTPRSTLRIKGGKKLGEAGACVACHDPLEAVHQLLQHYGPAAPSSEPFTGGLLGYLSYEAAGYYERLPLAAAGPLDLPDAAFLEVDTLLIFDHLARRARVVSHVWLDRPPERAYAGAVDRIEAVVHRLEAPVPAAPVLTPSAGETIANMTRQQFERMVASGKEHISAGDIIQVVLSHRLTLPLPGDPFGLYRRLRVVSPSPYMYFLDFVDHQIAGASPELLVQVRDGRVSSRPIAGTRRRGMSQEEDEALAKELLEDEKERAEHLMLVDLARNDVGRVSAPGSVLVRDFMRVERFSHVMHLVSDVEGRLAPGRSPLDALRAAFPAGTVSGAPKIRAMEVIAEQEHDRRGPYAGAVGFVTTSGDLEMAITIRTGVIQAGKLHVQAGAGVVADSEPAREYEEAMNKARALLEAAGSKT